MTRPTALLAVVASLLLAGCSSSGPEVIAVPVSTSPIAPPTPEPTPTPAMTPVAHPGSGDCVRNEVDPDGTTNASRYQGTVCEDPLAIGKIIEVLQGSMLDGMLGHGPRCSDKTDFVVKELAPPWVSSTTTATPGFSLDVAKPTSVYCVRNLADLHPGDPGKGGGVIRKGDCLTKKGNELPCNVEAGAYWKVIFIREPPLTEGKDCPDASDESLYDVMKLGGFVDYDSSREFCVKKV